MEQGGMKKRKKGGKKERERERKMGGEQRNWKMREGLEKGQDEKKKKKKRKGRGREREGGSMCFVESQFCGRG